MKFHTALFGPIMILNLTGCTSAKEMKDEAEAEHSKAQAGYTEEKTATLREYKECVNKSEGVPAKMAQCEALLKAVGAVEGGTVAAPAVAAPAEAAPAAEESTQPADAAEPSESSN